MHVNQKLKLWLHTGRPIRLVKFVPLWTRSILSRRFIKKFVRKYRNFLASFIPTWTTTSLCVRIGFRPPTEREEVSRQWKVHRVPDENFTNKLVQTPFELLVYRPHTFHTQQLLGALWRKLFDWITSWTSFFFSLSCELVLCKDCKIIKVFNFFFSASPSLSHFFLLRIRKVQTSRCAGECGCEQKYKWHRLLAYDPDNDCKGIFMDWFLFPSCCVCRCNPLWVTTLPFSFTTYYIELRKQQKRKT